MVLSPRYDVIVEDKQEKGGGDHGRRQRVQQQVEKLRSWSWFTTSGQRVGFLNIGSGWVLEKILGSGSGRSVEIYDRVFSGILFTLVNFRVFLGIRDPRISSLFWW